MVEAMFALLECARDTGEYSYFHFLSGDDMPIKDNEIVFNFFENSYPKNFIDILDFENVNKKKRNKFHREKTNLSTKIVES